MGQFLQIKFPCIMNLTPPDDPEVMALLETSFSAILEFVPNGYEGPANLLRSLPHPPSKALVRFINRSNVEVEVKWVDFDGQLQLYRTLDANEHFDCDTFVDHAWVFNELLSKDPMVVENKQVYWPVSNYSMVDDHPVFQRTNVFIQRPMQSLLILAARALRNTLRNITEPFCLEIPFHLKVLIVTLQLDYVRAKSDQAPNTRINVTPDSENSALLRDFRDFQNNIHFACHRLFLHACKLLILAKRLKGNGLSGLYLRQCVETISYTLGYEPAYNEPGMHTKKLAPILWKQLMFLRIHLDNLKGGCGGGSGHVFYNTLMKRIVLRRLSVIPHEQINSIQKYHWEQLNLLANNLDILDTLKDKDDISYDIPGILPLSERTEWEWVEIRRKFLLEHPNKDAVIFFGNLTAYQVKTTSLLENIFQVLCFLHYHLTGHHLSDEDVGVEETQDVPDEDDQDSDE